MQLLIVIVAYILGNFSPSYVIGRLSANIDIRNYGSGNAGTTNVMRTLGYKAAVFTLLLDCFKGVLAVYIAKRFGSENLAMVAGIVVVLGHNWPVLLKFKGGKGIATTIGVALSIHPVVASICIFVGIILLIIFKYVSLSSIVAITLLPIILFFQDLNYFIFGLVLCLMALYRHKENMQRLLNGTEKKFTEKLKVK
ncbi:acyl-phosphate glycerol-3-phosphate acyltransferase [Natronincola peptidivorans]|uniref:Glycerol-3-phosphate acyltransferase n=1 Tax=Natronincola peptidivorans TaxID=426128 RepID=A0A1H9Y889_9FIRM|nr:glycerol-3-phosphate 1-O-acyltransferase PlsY [Natronincola peptidivorans]SES65130.1 acyl-phosphate glycerol-3-phosphate acyltransferase [Natronincola peptidivorans]